jgi:hypothetical protein
MGPPRRHCGSKKPEHKGKIAVTVRGYTGINRDEHLHMTLHAVHGAELLQYASPDPRCRLHGRVSRESHRAHQVGLCESRS